MEHTTDTHQRRRLTRVSDGRMVAGVANGIAAYFDIDAWIVRAAFIALTFIGGSGGIIYIAGIVLLPRQDDPVGSSHGERLLRGDVGRGPWPFIGLVLLVMFFAGGFGFRHHFFFFPFPLLLILGGIFLFRDRFDTDRRWHPATSTGPTATGDVAATSEFTSVGATEGAITTESTVTTSAYGGSHRRDGYANRHRSPLRMLTIGTALLALGSTIALSQSDLVHLRGQQVLAVPIIVVGLGLLTGALYGHARKLMFSVTPLLLLATAASIADVPIDASAGSHFYTPQTAADVQSSYALGAGRTILDLSNIHGGVLPAQVTVNQGAGLLLVVLPEDSQATVDAEAGAGVVEVLGRNDNGMHPNLHVQTYGSGATMKLNLRDGFGRVVVTSDSDQKEAK